MPEDPIRDLLQSPVRSDNERSRPWMWGMPIAIAAIAAVGSWVLRDRPAPPDDQACASTTTTTTAVTVAPAIVLEEPLVFAGSWR